MPRLTKLINVVVLFAVLLISVDQSQSTDCSFSASSYNGAHERFIVLLNSSASTASKEQHLQWLNECMNKPTQKLATADFSTASVDRSQVIDFSVDGKLHGYTAWFDAKFVEEQLSKRSDTLLVEKDTPMSIHAAIPANDNVQKKPIPNLDRIDQAKFPLDKRYVYPKSAGSGVTAYVVDTGILVSHSEFEGRAKFGGAFCPGCSKIDDNGHGSHVAGTIAGKTYGVAKKANLIGVKVFPADGSGTSADIINGLMFVLNDHKKKKNNAVVNMSFGGPLSKAMNNVIKSLTDDGVHVVVAAGNIAADACKSSPSSEKSAITVGATEDTTDNVADFSNFGKCVDIFAPGRNILSVGTNTNDDVEVFSGTSQSAPHVAGTVALIISEKGNSSPANMAKTLINLATKNVITKISKGSPNVFLRVPQ